MKDFSSVVKNLDGVPVVNGYDIDKFIDVSMHDLGRAGTKINNDIVRHPSLLNPFIILPFGESSCVLAQSITITKKFNAPFFRPDEEINPSVFRTKLWK